MIDTSLHNLIILQMFKVVMTWPEWKMGYFKKKRKEREEYIAQRKVLNFLLPRILPPKIAAPSMKRKCSAICKLSIWYVFSFQDPKNVYRLCMLGKWAHIERYGYQFQYLPKLYLSDT